MRTAYQDRENHLEASTQTSFERTASTVSLPTEVVDYVVDFLHSDFDSLRSCTLVSQQWLPESSFHLFRRIRWPPCIDHWRYSSTGYPDANCKCHLIDESYSLEGITSLFNTTSRIATNVRQLQIRMEWYTVGRNPNVPRVTTPEQLALILHLAPSLHTLEVLSLKFSSFPSLSPLPAGRSIRRLDLVSFPTDVNMQGMLVFLSHFTSICALSLWDVNSDPEKTYEMASVPTCALSIRANELDLSVLSARPVWLQFLSRHLDLSFLTSLSNSSPPRGPVYVYYDEKSTTLFRDFLRKCHNLRSLTFCGDPHPGIFSAPFTCSTLSELHYLPPDHWSGRLRPHFDPMLEVLRCKFASATKVAVIDLTYPEDVYTDFAQLDLAKLRQEVKKGFEDLDWAQMNDAIRRLQSLRLEVRLRIRRMHILGQPRPRDVKPLPDVWWKDAEACCTAVEAAIRGRVHIGAHQKFELRVSLLTLR
ncbi:hypothetical protein PsYK624_085150 [Phanerochaete sordida]|uniref:F-box domain-containing protein n=1 Tax=Phanerochaete sordida TaxID=48140 RepID=A0A9P3GCH1_9APHY|nr:hypothetical protein PsYK624_085150 [Phanerochaete sordida]